MRSAAKLAHVHGDRIGRRAGREIGLERHAERDLRGQRAAAGGRIERHAGVLAQPLERQQFRRRLHRAVEPEADLGGRALRERIRHLEHAVGDRQLAAGRNVDVAAADIDGGGAAGDANAEVGIANRRQAVHRTDFGAVPDNLDRQSLVGDRRAARLHRRHRRIGGDHQPLDRAAGDVLLDPGAHLGRAEERPDRLHRRHRHAGAGDADGQSGVTARKVDAARRARRRDRRCRSRPARCRCGARPDRASGRARSD